MLFQLKLCLLRLPKPMAPFCTIVWLRFRSSTEENTLAVLKQSSHPPSNGKRMVLRVHFIKKNLTSFSIKKTWKNFFFPQINRQKNHGTETFRITTPSSLDKWLTHTNSFQNNFYYYIKTSQGKIDAYFFYNIIKYLGYIIIFP